MAAVRFDAVTKRFGEVTALSDLTLEHRATASSSCSSVRRARARRRRCGWWRGSRRSSSGAIRVGERVVNRLAPRDRDIAMVFQDYALYPQMTVHQNLAFGLKMRKMPKEEIERRVRHAAEMLDIEELLERKPRELSGGQRQRVALGRALVREPEVFLMDEPLSNLDAKLRAQTRSEIKRLQEQVGTTTIYVTHDQVEAMTMGDRVAVMNEGVLEQVGDTRTVYEHPANMFVAGFIGSPAMSFATVDAARSDGTLRLSRGELSLTLDAVHLPADVSPTR